MACDDAQAALVERWHRFVVTDLGVWVESVRWRAGMAVRLFCAHTVCSQSARVRTLHAHALRNMCSVSLLKFPPPMERTLPALAASTCTRSVGLLLPASP